MKLQFLQTFIAKLTMLRLTCEVQKQNIMDFSDPCFFQVPGSTQESSKTLQTISEFELCIDSECITIRIKTFKILN